MDIHRRMHEGNTWELAAFAGDDLPVTGVDNERHRRVLRSGCPQREGRTYRVPTINEYEFANRAGTDYPLLVGCLQPDVRRMNFALSRIGHPLPVGSYPANPWGFGDLHGNVWEYCADRDLVHGDGVGVQLAAGPHRRRRMGQLQPGAQPDAPAEHRLPSGVRWRRGRTRQQIGANRAARRRGDGGRR